MQLTHSLTAVLSSRNSHASHLQPSVAGCKDSMQKQAWGGASCLMKRCFWCEVAEVSAAVCAMCGRHRFLCKVYCAILMLYIETGHAIRYACHRMGHLATVTKFAMRLYCNAIECMSYEPLYFYELRWCVFGIDKTYNAVTWCQCFVIIYVYVLWAVQKYEFFFSELCAMTSTTWLCWVTLIIGAMRSRLSWAD